MNNIDKNAVIPNCDDARRAFLSIGLQNPLISIYRGETKMKYAVIFIALAFLMLAIAAPVSAKTVQIASGSMTGVTQSIQVSGNFNMGGKNVEQYSDASMKCVGQSIQIVGNVNWKGKNVQQQATGTMKYTFKSVQVVPNVNIA